MERYSVYFKAELFEDARRYGGEWYGVDYGNWKDANELYNYCRANGIEVELHDNEYDVSLIDDEWY